MGELTERNLFAETYGNVLTRALGIRTATPGLVDLTPEFLLLEQEPLRERTHLPRPGLAAGCEYQSRGLTPVSWATALTNSQLEQAALLYATDLVLRNPDRKRGNPNCALLGQDVFAYDFELCFFFLLDPASDRGCPWQVSKLPLAREHVFYMELHANRRKVTFEPFLEALSELSDERLEATTVGLPMRWRSLWAGEVMAWLAEARDHRDELRRELARCIA